MSQKKEKSFTTNKIVVLIGLLICLASACPCAWGLSQIPPVVQYAQATGKNAALQILIPIVLAAGVNALGLMLILVSLFISGRSSNPEK